jgi:hypothetical protein
MVRFASRRTHARRVRIPQRVCWGAGPDDWDVLRPACPTRRRDDNTAEVKTPPSRRARVNLHPIQQFTLGGVSDAVDSIRDVQLFAPG